MPTKLSFRGRGLARYALALAVVGIAFLLREGLVRLAGGELPTYITFYPAIALSGLLGGFGPGMLATLTAALAADYWILPPQGSFMIEKLSDALGLAVFSGMGVFLSVVFELYRRARQKVAAYEGVVAYPPKQEHPPQTFGERVVVNAGLVLSLALLAAVGWQVYRDLEATAKADEWETHTYLVTQDLDRLLSATQDVEAGQRGFIITGEERYLEPYNQALPQVDNRMAALNRLTQDNPRQQQTLARLEPVIREKLAELKSTIDLRRNQGFPAALAVVATDKGKALMDQIRRLVADAQGEEASLLEQRRTAKRRDVGRTLQALLAGGTLGMLLLAAAFVFLKQENSRRVLAEAELRRHRDRLQETVAARTAELSSANESLRQQREWLRVTLTSIGDAVLATDTTGRITFLNPMATALTGWPEDVALGQPAQSVFRIINEQTHAPGEDIVARVLREGQIVALANHTVLVTRGGSEVPVEDTAAPIKDSVGNVSGVVLVFHDVTGKRRAQGALLQSEQRLRALGNNLPGIAIYQHVQEPGGRMHYAFMSAGIETIFGMTAERVMADADAFRQLVIEEDRRRCAAAEEKSAREMATFDCEFRQRTVTGDLKWVHCRSTPRRLENGAILWDGAVTDITERKQAEETLQITLQRFYVVLSCMYSGVLLVTDEGRVEFANQSFCDRFGLKEAPADLVGLESPAMLEKVKHAYARPDEAVARIRELLHRGQSVEAEEVAMRDGGTCLRDFVPLNVQGKSYGRLWIHFDITDRKRAEERIEASLREKEVLLKEIHHRVKNNLQVISSLMDLQADALKEPALRSVFADMRDRIRSMALVHEKLYQSESLARVEFAEYARSLLANLWRAHADSAATVRLKLDLQPLSLSVVTAVPCGLLLNELVTNALKHAFRGRSDDEITVEMARSPEGRVCLRVRDNGLGLPPGLDWRQSRSLGLRLVQMLVRQLEGALEVKIDAGTEFQVTFLQQTLAQSGKEDHE